MIFREDDQIEACGYFDQRRRLPSLNAAIRGVAKGLYQEFGKDVEIYGIKDGYKGLIFGEYKKMAESDFPAFSLWGARCWAPPASLQEPCGLLMKTAWTKVEVHGRKTTRK